MLCRRVFQPFVSYSETRRILPSIHGLGKVNQFIVASSFTMETLFSIITALQPRDWITKIDLKDVCHHRLFYVNLWKLFRLVVAGIFFRFHVLSFGLSTTLGDSPRCLMWSNLCALRASVSNTYWDDWIMHAHSPNEVWNIQNKLFNFFSLWVARSTQPRRCYNPHTFWTFWC